MNLENYIKKVVKFNSNNIKEYLKEKNINIDYIDEIFDKIEVSIGEQKDSPYAKIDRYNSFKIIISEDISNEDIYKWLNHEMIHVISNNLKTINDINVGGVIIEDKEKNIWIGQYLNEAITEYINQSIIKNKYSNYYDRYIEALMIIMNIIGEDIVLKAYFTNNLNLIIDSLINKTRKSKKDVLSYINSIDYLYDEEDYQTKLKI